MVDYFEYYAHYVGDSSGDDRSMVVEGLPIVTSHRPQKETMENCVRALVSDLAYRKEAGEELPLIPQPEKFDVKFQVDPNSLEVTVIEMSSNK